MLISMRALALLLGCGLALGCSSADDSSGDGAAGSANHVGHGGAAGNGSAGSATSAGTNASSAGTATASGGSSSGGNSASAGGSNGKAGASSSAGTTGTAGGSTNPNDPYGDARIRCVNRTNELRATKGLPPIPRLASAEPCADGQAKSDSESGKAHGAFDACLDQVEGWKGVAQNECPNYGSVEDTLTKCLDAMWAEGPGGGHYDNMTGDSTDTACGIYTTPTGKVWLVQDFWTK
jgi:hypothetical protein